MKSPTRRLGPLFCCLSAGASIAAGACGDPPLVLPNDADVDSVNIGTDATSATVDVTATDSGPRIDDRPTLLPDTTGSELPKPVEGEPLGGDRPARVVLPANYDPARAWPLVVLLHGYSAGGTLEDLYLEFSPKASAAGWIVLVPDGTRDAFGFSFWNADPGWCCNFARATVDDAGYLAELIAEARARYHVDSDHIAAFGHSNGAFMAHTLACDGRSGVTAVAALAGVLPSRTEDCDPPRPVSVLQIQGTLDLVIAYGGLAGSYPSVDTNVERWRLYNRCKGAALAGDAKDYDFAILGAETHPTTSASCAADTTVTLWRMEASGHLPIPMPAFVPDLLTWLGTHGTSAPFEAD